MAVTVRPSHLFINRALDYSLKRWAGLSRYLNDGAVPIDNNWAETKLGHGRLDAKTGSSQGRCAAENGPRQS